MALTAMHGNSLRAATAVAVGGRTKHLVRLRTRHGSRPWLAMLLSFTLLTACDSNTKVSYQLPDLPLKFSVDLHGKVSVSYSKDFVTPLGTFSVTEALESSPDDSHTRVYITRPVEGVDQTDGYEIKGRDELKLCVTNAEAMITQGTVRITAHDSSSAVVTEPEAVCSSAADTPRATAVAFQPFGNGYGTFTFTQSGDAVDISSPGGADRYAHLYGAWVPGSGCYASTVSFDTVVDAPPTASDGYGFAVGFGDVGNDDQPVGSTLQDEWQNDGSFYARTVQLPSGAWIGSQQQQAVPDITRRHHVVATRNGDTYDVTIDSAPVGTFPAPARCRGLLLRVWGGAELHVTHLEV
ncbi:hypothetical protein QA811_43795 [Streptomyces sp. B21-102]|uniref:hypothetical protein n=1 Tax=unclassified Streptomyces TaxID=2593676 RepID=UPI002FF3E56C